MNSHKENKIYGPRCPVCMDISEQRWLMITPFWFCSQCKIDVDNKSDVEKKRTERNKEINQNPFPDIVWSDSANHIFDYLNPINPILWLHQTEGELPSFLDLDLLGKRMASSTPNIQNIPKESSQFCERVSFVTGEPIKFVIIDSVIIDDELK